MNSLNSEPKQTHSTLLLPENWEITEVFEDRLRLLDHPISIFGFAAKNSRTNKSIHGSAADYSKEKASLRAYYELIERISILELHSAHQEPIKGLIRPSLSNGVAIHTNLTTARLNAALELLERDAVLDHWYQAQSPIEYLDQEHKLYEFQTAVPGISTWMTLLEKKDAAPGFPTQWIGYGTCMDSQGGIQKSKLEALQSACFTHDIELATDLPALASPELHLDFILSPIGNRTLNRWLRSERYMRTKPSIALSDIEYDEFEFKLGTETVYSVKARHPNLRLLDFGVADEFRGTISSYSSLLQTHPLEADYRSLPHPIA